MNITLDEVLTAKRPEDVFGDLSEDRQEAEAAAARARRELTLRFHPDRNPDPRAGDATAILNVLHDLVKAGRYGKARAVDVRITTRRHTYKVTDLLATGAACNVYAATISDADGERDGIVKVVRDSRDGDLIQNEARTLKAMLSDPAVFDVLEPYIPTYVEAFGYRPGREKPRQALAIVRDSGVYTLREVRERYPDGVHPKDAAWMLRRLLMAIGYAHLSGYVHGAVLPEHVLIHPELHGLILIDWKYAAAVGSPMRARPKVEAGWYPPEVAAKAPVGPGTDIFMAMRCMAYVLGGDAAGNMPERVPVPIRAFLRGSTQERVARRPNDALALKEEYDELIERLWGPRRFRPFHM